MKARSDKCFKKIKIKWPSFVKDLKEAVMEKIATGLVVFIFLVVSIFLVSSFIHGSEYFRVKAVETRGLGGQASGISTSNELLHTYKNRNLFDIDLKVIAKYLAAKYQDARVIVVKRTLPDRLTVMIELRKPVAILSNSRHYPVDEEGVILLNIDPNTLRGLPLITGVDQKYWDRVTRKNVSRNLRAALDLLREIKSYRFFNAYRITRIDAGDIAGIAFYLNDELEVKIGYENFRERLDVLKRTLKDTRLVKDRIKYIDVRFEDVSIGTK